MINQFKLATKKWKRISAFYTFKLSLNFQNEVPDAEPECDSSSISTARSLWSDRMSLAGSKELTIEVQDYIPFSKKYNNI